MKSLVVDGVQILRLCVHPKGFKSPEKIIHNTHASCTRIREISNRSGRNTTNEIRHRLLFRQATACALNGLNHCYFPTYENNRITETNLSIKPGSCHLCLVSPEKNPE